MTSDAPRSEQHAGNVQIKYVLDTSKPPDIAAGLSPFKALPAGQAGNTLAGGTAGEYRAVYEGCSWLPSYSTYGPKVRGGKPHDGIDLFAPVGTEVVAVVNGRAIYYDDDGSEFGNRITLAMKIDGVEWFFLYAHLQTFSPAEKANNNKIVAASTILARTGCTGNASYNCGPGASCQFGGKVIASSHLHIVLVKSTTAGPRAFDIVAATGWKLATPAKPV